MFTGIIETLGRIAAMEPTGGDLRLTIAFSAPAPTTHVGAAHGCDRGAPQHAGSPSQRDLAAHDRDIGAHRDAAVAAMGSSYIGVWPDPLRLGESIAVSGVCLTVVAFGAHGFSADVSTETLSRTTLGDKCVGDPVNLERALLPTTRLGGHLVAGHVDGVGQVLVIADEGRAQRWRFSAPVELMRFIAEKGSIAVDGTSLTVNAVGADWFEVALIPHTVANTAFADARIGDSVNLEADLIARYIARHIAANP